MSIQLYGHWDDNGSFAVVSRGITRTLRRKGLTGSVFAMKSLAPKYLDTHWPIGLDSRAHVGICVGYPPESVGYLIGHEHKILVTVCESDRIPRQWVDCMTDLSLVVVPSAFCARAFKESGVKAPILVAPHGIDERLPLLAPPEPREDGLVKLLHVSGAASFPKRKGTAPLLVAFARLIEEPEFRHVRLSLRLHPGPGTLQVIRELHLQDFVTIDETPCPDAVAMARHLQRFDAVVQPSRGEGFGMVPLEARCVGVPVVMTAETGHLQHYAPDVDVKIATGDWSLISTQGNGSGAAPFVSPDAVYDALVELVTNLPERKARTREWARKYARDWTWPKVLTPLARHVASHAKDAGPLRLGQEAGYRGH